MSNREKGRKGILVILSMGLGDVVFALPVLRVLKRAYPADPVTFLTSAQNADLLSLVPEVERIVSYPNKTPLALWRLVKEVRRHPHRMVVVLNPLFRGSVLAWCSAAPVRVGYLRDYERKQSLWGLGRLLLTHSYLPRDRSIHEVERYLDLMRMFGLSVTDGEKVLRLVLTEETREFGHSIVRRAGDAHQGPPVAISPGAGWELRRWPEERFAEIADWLAEQYDARIIYLGGRAERGLVSRIIGRMRYAAESFAGRTTLSELAGLIAASELLLANDSGVMHIAAALHVPTIALFGPGDPVKVRPLSPHATVLYHKVPCSPCRVQYTNKCQNNICMQQISVNEVKAAISRVLGRKAKVRWVPSREAVRSAS